MIRDHKRATAAFEHLEDVKQWPIREQKEYRSVCLNLPTLVHTQGLVPALHFIAARSEQGQRRILGHLALQLQAAGLVKASDKSARAARPAPADLLRAVRSADLPTLQAMTRETQRVLTWYKRLVQSELRELGRAAVQGQPEGEAP